MQERVLVTGAFGNVGRFTVRTLLDQGRRVVATDLRTPAAEAAYVALGPRSDLEVVWADLTDPDAVRELVAACRPGAVIHLAAVIPPLAYARPHVAHAVNVEATRNLVAAVAELPEPCRFVHASSIAVHGSRNPHTMAPLTATSEIRPCETYGAGKAAAEEAVTAAGIDWTILRLGAVIFPDLDLGMDPDAAFLEAMLPADGRVQTVDARDVARALVAATTASCSGEVLMIGGDGSHRMSQGELSRDLVGALGLPGALPPGLPGNPDDDEGWFMVDWMDTTRAQQLLDFQRHPWSETRAAISAHAGFRRRVLPLAVPLVRLVMALRSPHRGGSSGYTELWPAVVRRWGPAATVNPVGGQR